MIVVPIVITCCATSCKAMSNCLLLGVLHTFVAKGGGGIARCCGPMLMHVNSLKGSGLSTSSSCCCWMQLVSRRLAALTTAIPPGLCDSSMQLELPASSLRLHQKSLPSSCCSCTSCWRRNLRPHKAAMVAQLASLHQHNAAHTCSLACLQGTVYFKE